MKKIILAVVISSLLVALAACSAASSSSAAASGSAAASTSGAASGEEVGSDVVNPFVDCTTMKEAEELAGFPMFSTEGLPAGYTQSAIRIMKGKMIEVIYTSGADEIRLRKATGQEDISGDMNEYAENNTLNVGGVEVITRGTDGKIMVATWKNDAFSFSLTASAGVEQATVETVVTNASK